MAEMPDAAAAPNHAAPDAAPDWGTTTDDLLCPLCDYNLRGLTQPVCPECGYRFVWRDLTALERRIHPYLFEHHPEREVWSFRKTVCGGLRPTRFWTSLFPTQPSNPRRLVRYWAAACLLALPGAASLYVLDAARLYRERLATARAYPLPGGAVSTPTPVTAGDVWAWSGRGYLFGWVLACAWPWLTFGTLSLFRFSMRRARVKPVHVFRCTIYCGDGLVWAGMLLTAFSGALTTAMVYFDTPHDLFEILPAYVVAGYVLWSAHRLSVAYAAYLRFDHSDATVLVSQLIVGMAILAVTPERQCRQLMRWVLKQLPF